MNSKQIIRDIKNESGLTIFELAEHTQISQTTLDNWLYLKSVPSADNFLKFLDKMGYDFTISKREVEE